MPQDMTIPATAIAALEPPRRSALAPMGIVPKSYEEIWRLAKATCQGGLAPRFENNPSRVSAIMMCGMEVGLKPMASLRLMYQTPDGQPALMVRGMLAVVQASGLLAHFEDRLEGDAESRAAVVTVERQGQPRITRRFSVADAKRAQLTGKRGDMYQKYLDRMLYARAVSFALNDLFADILGGLYDPSEMGGPVFDDDGKELPPPAAPVKPEAAPPASLPAPAVPADFWSRVSLRVARPVDGVDRLVERLLRVIPEAPGTEDLDRLFEHQDQGLIREAMEAERWAAVDDARRARFDALMSAADEEPDEEEPDDGHVAEF
jgi:hypothetical protein